MRLLILLVATLTVLAANCVGAPARGSCGRPGDWFDTAAAPAATAAAPLLERMARQQAVLLGETHDSAEDHRWQLHTLAQLHALQPRLAIGFEMFPRRLQGVLDDWVAGRLDEREFLARAEWDTVWGYDARDYLPLFHFARMHRLPMLALNVERELIETVGKQGWDALPADRREGLGRPAPPSADYRKRLREIFEHHPERAPGEAQDFERFVLTQTVWDRAMAEVIARHLERQPDALVVGILGAGHVRHGHGVAHQLRALGIQRSGALLTWRQDESCGAIAPGIADAVQIVAPPAERPQRIGVAIAPPGKDDAGLRISEVERGSIAEQAGLQAGDLILAVAGQPVRKLQTLRNAVQRQPAGTWLPLKVRRGDAELEIIARFPANP